ncbi:SGNH/GDSL hydrolase family protein [Kutzneria buriramensis]|uniref:GDSL-like lipase/acylhydrolase family protein n=1 Tax=Kutzneria buriramensis TaxID=1045776 RepID=A0A3E0GZW3_9PSEU|nr:SGNH/GDSL hydrolase family protein [Kutzneria buriramensis]REH34923.1 GDSL-like lipase/acylhydrolase family protein [Kutzneria buriramensis]
MRRTVFVCLLVAMLACGTAAAASATPAFHEYVALGDSWSADSTVMPTRVATTFAPFGCGQSVGDYPKQVASALGITNFRDATCGSASTVELTRPQGVPFGGVNPPQFDRLTPTTDLVTLGIGGNDIGLAGAITGCLNLLPSLGLPLPAPLGGSCESRWVSGGVDQMSVNIAHAEPLVAAAIEGIRVRSPHATVLVVDYLQGLAPHGCWPYVPMLDGDVRWLRAKLEETNAMLRRVAAAEQVGFVDTYSTSAGHDFCQLPGTNWVEGLLPLTTSPLGLAVPFHPNQLGADHQAGSVLSALGRPSPTAP